MFSWLAGTVTMGTDTRLKTEVRSRSIAAFSEYSASSGAEQDRSLETVKMTLKAVPRSITGNRSVIAMYMYACTPVTSMRKSPIICGVAPSPGMFYCKRRFVPLRTTMQLHIAQSIGFTLSSLIWRNWMKNMARMSKKPSSPLFKKTLPGEYLVWKSTSQ